MGRGSSNEVRESGDRNKADTTYCWWLWTAGLCARSPVGSAGSGDVYPQITVRLRFWPVVDVLRFLLSYPASELPYTQIPASQLLFSSLFWMLLVIEGAKRQVPAERRKKAKQSSLKCPLIDCVWLMLQWDTCQLFNMIGIDSTGEGEWSAPWVCIGHRRTGEGSLQPKVLQEIVSWGCSSVHPSLSPNTTGFLDGLLFVEIL